MDRMGLLARSPTPYLGNAAATMGRLEENMRERFCWAGFVVLAALAVVSCQGPEQAGAAPSPAESATEIQGFFPSPGDLGEGVAPGGEYAEYGRDTLYDYINGGAEVYLDLDFVKVGAQDYVADLGGETWITLDVYDMAEPQNAFGIYRAEAYGENPPADFGLEGYMAGGSLVFLSGPYYVKITGDRAGEEVDVFLGRLAGMVSERIGDPGSLPAELGLFPSQDRVAGSETYAARNLLGIGPLKGYSCRYESDGQEVTLHFGSWETEAEAVEAEAAFLKRMETTPVEDGETPFDNRYLGRGKVLRIGSHLAIAQFIEVEDEAWAESLAVAFFEAVK